MKRRWIATTLLLGGCVYFNTMYNAGKDYGSAEKAIREGDVAGARTSMDSVIAKTGRVITNHPDSKYADDAALMKTRAEVYRELWESAQISARFADSITTDPKIAAPARGLDGLASFHLSEFAEADSLLTASLDGDLDPDDRTTFLLTRGRVRLALGDADGAAADLTLARAEADPSLEARLDLARALTQVGDYDGAVAVSREMLEDENFSAFDAPMRAYLDSLIALAPVRTDTMLGALLAVDGNTGPEESFFYLLQGRARQFRGDREGALQAFLASRDAAPQARTAGTASLLAAMQILEDATEPEQVEETVVLLGDAQRLAALDLRELALEMALASEQFTKLVAAYESRGAEAAEALLRAAELADIHLDALHVARGLYLEYLQVVPDSRWAGKAMFGALLLSGYQAGAWVDDRGVETDAELRSALRALPASDPYRAAVVGTVASDSLAGPGADSLYVLAEVDLQRRLTEIQGLFDPSVFLAAPDSAAAADTAAAGVFFEEVN